MEDDDGGYILDGSNLTDEQVSGVLSGLMDLLDDIDVSGDASLCSHRFDIYRRHGINVVFIATEEDTVH